MSVFARTGPRIRSGGRTHSPPLVCGQFNSGRRMHGQLPIDPALPIHEHKARTRLERGPHGSRALPRDRGRHPRGDCCPPTQGGRRRARRRVGRRGDDRPLGTYGRGRQQRREPAAPELRRQDRGQRRGARDGSPGSQRRAPARRDRRPGEGAHDDEGHGRRDRAGREVQHLGVRRTRRSRARRPRPPGPDGRDDAHERRRDPALDRLPRGTDRAERRIPRRRPGRIVHVQVPRERPGRLHVPLRHQAGARAHRERDVRRDRGRSREAASARGPRVRPRSERVVPERPRESTSPRRSTWRRLARCSPTGRRSTATRTST